MKPWLKDLFLIPRNRCLISLALVCLALTVALQLGTYPRPWGSTLVNVSDVVTFIHLPLALFLPLFLVARSWVLTPVVLSVTLSLSTGLITFFLPILANGNGGRNGMAQSIVLFEFIYLFAWFFISWIQLGLHTQYGFSSALPTIFIFFGILGYFIPELVVDLLPFIGMVYSVVAFNNLRRIRQTARPPPRPPAVRAPAARAPAKPSERTPARPG